MSSSRLPALDIARGMAALAVVLFHYTCLNETAREDLPGLARFTVYGYLGVHLFFLISGYVIFMTLERTKNSIDFLFARASRLYPSFLLSIALTILCIYLLTDNIPFSMRDIALNMTMFPDILGAKMVNPAYWTLGIEVVFYGIIFLAIIIAGKKGITPIVLGWFALSVFNSFVGLGIAEKLLILKWAPLFTGGAALYLATRETHWRRTAYLALFLITLPVAAHYTLLAFIEQKSRFSFWQSDDITVVFVLAALYVVMGLIAFRPSGMSWMPSKFVELCGGGSYIIYLIHERVGNILITKLYPSFGATSIVLVIATMVVASSFIYMYFDKPAQKKLRAFRQQLLTTSSAIPVKA